jgi:hypothetical protein
MTPTSSTRSPNPTRPTAAEVLEHLNATASNVRPSCCVSLAENPGAVDVDVEVTIAGVQVQGEVTLIKGEYDGDLGSWGSPDHWVSSPVLDALTKVLQYDWQTYRCALTLIEEAARAAAAEVA